MTYKVSENKNGSVDGDTNGIVEGEKIIESLYLDKLYKFLHCIYVFFFALCQFVFFVLCFS